MNKLKMSMLALVMVMALVLTGCQAGCSKRESNNNATSNNTTNTSTDTFSGNMNPAMQEYSYRDEDSRIINNAIVVGEYEVEAAHQGKLQYEDYTTYDYDDDMHKMDKFLVVYTPYGYDPSKEYDIMYVTHGHTGGATTWFGSPSNAYETKNILDHLIEDGKVRPMIVVSVTYYDDNNDENTSDYDMEILNSFGKELRNDIIPQVEAKYNTYAKTLDPEGFKASRNHRIMGGFSMGGVATNLQMKESMDYFKYYMPVSGSLYWTTDAYANRSSYNSGRALRDAITAQGYGPNDFYMYMSTGTLDFAEPTVSRQMESMRQLSDFFIFGKPGEEGVNCSYGLGEGEGHNSHGRETALYNALPALSALIGRE